MKMFIKRLVSCHLSRAIFLFFVVAGNYSELRSQSSNTAISNKDIRIVEEGDSIKLYLLNGALFSELTFDVVYPQFQHYRFSEGLMLVKKNGKNGFLDKQGELVIGFEYDIAKPFDKGLAEVCKDFKWGFIDFRNNVVVPLIYDDVNEFTDNRSLVSLNHMYGYVDRKGKLIIPLKYKKALPFQGGHAVVGESMMGVIDTINNPVIPLMYDDIKRLHFGDGFAVKLSGLWGYINSSGKQIIKTQYEFINVFHEGKTIVARLSGKEALLSPTGKTILDFEFDRIEVYVYGVLVGVKAGKKGLFNEKGKRLAEVKYDNLRPGEHGVMSIVGGKAGYLTLKGRELLPPIYDEVLYNKESGKLRYRSGDTWSEVELPK